jgi:hypothetical protein
MDYGRKKYKGLECLMHLVSDIAWIASVSICYSANPYVEIVQDYHESRKISVRVFDRYSKTKERKATLRAPIDRRDQRKTHIATFAFFIHHIDASIAISVIEGMISLNAPIYTVHDNFITTPVFSKFIPFLYSEAFNRLGPPLNIMVNFIINNLIKPVNPDMPSSEINDLLADSEKLKKL